VATVSSLAEAAARADAGDWPAARDAYADLLAGEMSGDSCHGLARACWWLGETRVAVEHAECAFAAYEEEGRFADAAMVGVHLCLWYLSNFDNVAAADGWLARARHLAQRSGNDLTVGWITLVSGYVADDPGEGLRLIESAATTATSLSDRDLSPMALADLGLWHVTTGEVGRGMTMLDEAMATAFATPRRMLEVVVWSSCNMLAVCSLADLRRATQWCRAADRFMDTYGCPLLQARCRAHYGSVLVATGRWEEAERELAVALSMSADTGRGPRTEALTALAELRLRQGDHEAALILLDEADSTPSGVVTRARCLVDLGRPNEARSVLRGELALQQPDSPAYPTLVAVLAETELLAGRAEEAATCWAATRRCGTHRHSRARRGFSPALPVFWPQHEVISMPGASSSGRPSTPSRGWSCPSSGLAPSSSWPAFSSSTSRTPQPHGRAPPWRGSRRWAHVGKLLRPRPTCAGWESRRHLAPDERRHCHRVSVTCSTCSHMASTTRRSPNACSSAREPSAITSAASCTSSRCSPEPRPRPTQPGRQPHRITHTDDASQRPSAACRAGPERRHGYDPHAGRRRGPSPDGEPPRTAPEYLRKPRSVAATAETLVPSSME
jgi:tetratricopeptide (TPR) repeat protein